MARSCGSFRGATIGSNRMVSAAIGLRLPDGIAVTFTDEALDALAAALAERLPPPELHPSVSPYMTIPQASEYLRCSRQRIDDLLSQRRLTRVKEGARTLISRAEIEQYLTSSRLPAAPTRKRGGCGER